VIRSAPGAFLPSDPLALSRGMPGGSASHQLRATSGRVITPAWQLPGPGPLLPRTRVIQLVPRKVNRGRPVVDWEQAYDEIDREIVRLEAERAAEACRKRSQVDGEAACPTGHDDAPAPTHGSLDTSSSIRR
jgi:hypothetical protein